MRFKLLLISTFATLATSALFAATTPQLIIPAAGTGPGVNNSQWQSEVVLHNAGAQPITVTLRFHDRLGAGDSFQVTVPPRGTSVISDILATRFNQTGSVTGAVVIEADPAVVGKLAVTSRTFNRSAAGEFGQDIPAIAVSNTLGKDDSGILTAPSDALAYRFNFGVFAVEATTIQWRLFRRDGTLAGEVQRSYATGVHAQYNDGVRALLGSEPANSDIVSARVLSGKAIVYGSAVNQATNDPTFVPGIRTRENLNVQILGIDLDEDGVIDVADADQNGVLDEAIDVFTSTFPNYFRIVASDPEGSTLSYQLVNAPRDAVLIEPAGTIQWVPGADVRGTTTSLRVRVSDGTDATELIIPVIFR